MALIYIVVSMSITGFFNSLQRLIKTVPIAGIKSYHDHYNVNEMYRLDHHVLYNKNLNGSRILDFGCGYHYPTVLYLATYGADAHGLDILGAFQCDPYLDQLRADVIPMPALKKISMLPFYYDQMEQLLEMPLRHDRCQLTSYGGHTFPYDANSFDAVISNGTIQFVSDRVWLVNELSRVIDSNGYVNLNFKNDLALSATGTSDSRRLEKPWGHLRGEDDKLDRELWRHEDYLAFFDALGNQFSEVHVYLSDRINNLVKFDATLDLPFENADRFLWEGEREFSEDIPELTGVDSEELLRARSFKVVART